MLLESAARLEGGMPEADSGADESGAGSSAVRTGANLGAAESAAADNASAADSGPDSSVRSGIWNERAERFQMILYERYHNPATGILNQWFPGSHKTENEPFYYWWQAHVIDVFVDALERTDDIKYAERIEELAVHLRRSNGDTYLHNYYDDMEWLALAFLRAYQATGKDAYKQHVLELWADIRTAWNDNCGGGMAWKKDQLDYKNTPANAPAAILAARLYREFGDAEDLEWAKRIYAWNRDNLVDPQTGFVWDGLNRLGDGRIDKDWEFTYCQGVFLGAGVELYRCTGDRIYLEEARRTASACIERLCDPVSLKLPDEGIDDTGLFKGILVRYLMLLLEEAPDHRQVLEVLNCNAALLWRQGIDPYTGLCAPDWAATPVLPVQLSVQLSGIMLTEAAARLERRKIPAVSDV
ncbi:glycosyl hydrolase [Saccharibacillus sp. O16]|nr:glycosyl hydrolase [Saccharibacillus sp. O16]